MSDSAGEASKVPKIILWAPKGQMYQIYGKLNCYNSLYNRNNFKNTSRNVN